MGARRASLASWMSAPSRTLLRPASPVAEHEFWPEGHGNTMLLVKLGQRKEGDELLRKAFTLKGIVLRHSRKLSTREVPRPPWPTGVQHERQKRHYGSIEQRTSPPSILQPGVTTHQVRRRTHHYRGRRTNTPRRRASARTGSDARCYDAEGYRWRGSGIVEAKKSMSPAMTQQTSPTSHNRWDRRSGGSRAMSMKTP